MLSESVNNQDHFGKQKQFLIRNQIYSIFVVSIFHHFIREFRVQFQVKFANSFQSFPAFCIHKPIVNVAESVCIQ